MSAAVDARHFDVFNGDADGLCALHQLRLAEPKKSRLISGVKRDIALLSRVEASAGDSVTVLDLPVEANREALANLLAQGVSVEYFDHHLAEPPAAHPLLRLNLNPAASGCTSLLVNQRLNGRFAAWAVVGAFGDNLAAPAAAEAALLGLSDSEIDLLKALGECLNYNAYGDSEAELTIRPVELYLRMAPYANPLDFIDQESICLEIDRQWTDDRSRAMTVKPLLDTSRLQVVLLPDAPWARRILGSYANRLVTRHPGKVCAVLAPNTRHGVTVSLRTPNNHPLTADELLRPFGGAGRPAAAGVNNLPSGQVAALVRHLCESLGLDDGGQLAKIGEKPASTAADAPCQTGDALLIVDVQNDFMPGGSLPVPGSDQIIAPLNRWIARFTAAGLPVLASRDWHPGDHCSFLAQGGAWPAHCVAGSRGAEFANALELPATALVISKSTRCEIDAYSAFTSTELDYQLRSAAVHRLFVGGLATDYCVLNTVGDALRHGYQVVLLRDAMRAVELQPGDGEQAIATMLANGATLMEG